MRRMQEELGGGGGADPIKRHCAPCEILKKKKIKFGKQKENDLLRFILIPADDSTQRNESLANMYANESVLCTVFIFVYEYVKKGISSAFIGSIQCISQLQLSKLIHSNLYPNLVFRYLICHKVRAFIFSYSGGGVYISRCRSSVAFLFFSPCLATIGFYFPFQPLADWKL